MTVLMFGWEFPPHISGGLGTACLGLTRALSEDEVRVLFVVPRAHGDEEIELISASDVAIDETQFAGQLTEEKQNVQKISIASSLTPYSMYDPSQALALWNWEFQPKTKIIGNVPQRKFHFTGGYGPSLIDEVYRYAQVASVIANRNEFDIIHAHDWLTYLAGIKAKNISHKPLVIHVHATEVDRVGKENLNKTVFEIEREGMNAADAIIAVSQRTKDIIAANYGISKRKIYVVHNGVDEADKPEYSTMPKISDRVVTFLGRITYQKGPQYFVEAARKVLEHFPDTHFVMAGSGDLLPAMIDRVAELKLSSRIHFTGFLRGPQIQQIWSITDVYVMPSVSEPFGISALEAVDAGVPVILSSQSGASEVLEHAIKVDFWDVDSLASAVINVFKYKSMAESLKANSKDEVEALTWKRAAKKIQELYHEI